MNCTEDFEARFGKLQSFGDDKMKLIQDLISRVRVLEIDLFGSEQLLKRERSVINMYQRNDTENKRNLSTIQHAIDQMTFVSVLIDGDCMLFLDKFVKVGEQGGREASRLLKTCVLEHMRATDPELSPNITVVTRVYANLKGLAKAYVDALVLSSVDDLHSFVNGFNKEDAMCDFVNAGDGKECADEKLKQNFNMDISSIQCRHVIFGGSADNGYARLLGPHHRNRSKITLLEGPPFARELAEISSGFGLLKCPEIFCKTTQLAAPHFAAQPTQSTSMLTGNYAAVASSPASRAVVCSLRTDDGSSVRSTKPVFRNAAGQRIDQLIKCSGSDIKLLKMRKLCNEFHLLGKCSYHTRGTYCAYTHGSKINGSLLDALKFVARLSACPYGLSCERPACILGHQCPKVNCKRGKECNFPAVMHGVDSDAVP